MTDEQPFRIAVICLLALVVPAGLYFRLRSMAPGEKLARREEGLFILVALRLCGLAFFGGLIAYVIHPPWMAWASLPLPGAVRWAGAVLTATAYPLMIWVLRSLGKNLTDTVVTRAGATLVTGGPYRWVRHPFYCVGLLFFLGLTLLTANAFLGAAGLGAGVLLVLRTPTEERKLIERFGDDYREYMKSTGRFFPRLS